MSDLKTIDQQIDAVLDPFGLPESIKALAHNGLLRSVLKAVGKYTGSPFVAKASGQVPPGTLIWNDNAMDDTNPFIVTVSQLTSDGIDIGKILAIASPGDIVKFKDYAGRTVFLNFIGFVESDDGSGNDTYNINVNGFAENISFTYTTEEEDCVVELIASAVSGNNFYHQAKPIILKSPNNLLLTTLEIGDYVKTFITASLIIEGLYTGAAGDPNDLTDLANFNVLNSIDLTL